MKKLHAISFGVVMAAMAMTSCSDGKSYAQLLNEEDMYTNNFLADQHVELAIPADTVFEVGPNAPYYRLDDDGMLYMQVPKAGTKDNRVEDDEQIYFRYTRHPLALYSNGELPTGEGNNISLSPAWFGTITSGYRPHTSGDKVCRCLCDTCRSIAKLTSSLNRRWVLPTNRPTYSHTSGN